MKNLLLTAAIGLIIMTGCTTTGGSITGGSTLDEKALYGLYAGAYGVDVAIGGAITSGLLKPNTDTARKIATADDKLRQVVSAAQSAYNLGDASGYAAQIAAGQALVATAWSLVPTKGN